MSKRARTAVVGKDLHQRAFARIPHYEIAHARGYDAESHVQAMDIEGIDVAVLYGTRGRQVLMHDELDPAVARRARPRPQRLDPRLLPARARRACKFAAQVAFHDVPGAIAEARRAVRELGAVAVIGNPNPINGRHVHDPAVRAAVGGRRGARRAGRLPSDRAVVAPRRHRAPLPRHAERPRHRRGRPQPHRADDGLRQHGRRRRARAAPGPALRVPRGHVRLAAVVAVAARRGVGEVRARARRSRSPARPASTSSASASSPPTPTRSRSAR